MTDNRVFIDIHAIQTLPPSCVNRDDTGSPKTAVYGGVRRSRVSSQSWKHAMRKYFLEHSNAEVGIRSTDVIQYVADRIKEKDSSLSDKDALDMAEKLFKIAKIGLKDHKTKALFFLGKKQAENLAEAAVNGETDKDTICRIFKEHPSVDIALFGRMVADNKLLTADASAQVAHAISTHEVRTEFDYYAATDDLKPDDKSGANMLGTIEYNSSTLYRYATVALHDLENQLDDKEQAIAATNLFISAFANSMPAGRINSFANQTIPDLLMVSIRTDRPVSLVTAYEDPVKSKGGNIKPSIERLFQEVEKTCKFVDKPYKTFFVTTSSVEKPDWAEEEHNLTDLLTDVASSTNDLL